MVDETLRFDSVSHATSARDRIADVSFRLMRGDGLVICGPEGSGKSQIMSLILARYRPQQGEVYYQGKPLTQAGEGETEKIRFSIGYVAKNLGLINNLSVLENIILPLRYHTELKDDELFAAARLWLERYELAHREKARPVALSDSEAIRTTLIRALIVDPQILLLDGVLDGVCPLASHRLMELLFEDIRLRNMSYIITTYHPEMFAGRDLQFILLYRGQVVFQGALADIQSVSNAFLDQYRTFSTAGPMQPFNETV